MDDVPSDLIDLETARKATGETWARLRSWIKAGKVRSWKRGYYVVVSRAEVLEFTQQANAIRPFSPPPKDDMQTELHQNK